MNRLQKKCLVLSLALHAFLCVILIVGPAFLASKQKDLDLPILEVIPDRLTDLPFSGGGNPNAKPPPLAASRIEPPRPQPVTPQPKPAEPVTRRAEVRPPPDPAKDAEAVSIERKHEKPQIKVESRIVKRPANKAPEKARQTEEEDAKTQAQAEAESRRRTAQQLVARINSSSERISENLSAGTTIEPLGPGGPAYANYAQVVKTYYDRAWIDPEEVSENAATVKVRVVIARDGAVVSDSIITRSGVSSLDKSVENALRRVQQLPPFPEGAKEAQRTFIINFNLKAKRLLG